jgi:hypothetical protein
LKGSMMWFVSQLVVSRLNGYNVKAGGYEMCRNY